MAIPRRVEAPEEKKLEDEFAKENRIVAGWLLYVDERRKAYHQRRKEIIESSPPFLQQIPSGKGHLPSDQTGRKGIELAELAETEKWIELIEEIEKRLPWKMQIILRLRRESKYASKRDGYVVYVQRQYAEELARRLNKAEEDVWVSEITIKRWWGRIVEYAARLASKRGLLT